MPRFCALVDGLSDVLGRLAAWLYFLTGGLLGYEVAARYLFNAPTIWVQEIAQLLLLWATFLAIGRALRHDQHIRINALEARLSVTVQRWFRGFSLLFIATLCLLVVYYGGDILGDSFQRGRSTGTMLNIPNWWAEAVIPIGFGVLFLQAIAQLLRLHRPSLKA